MGFGGEYQPGPVPGSRWERGPGGKMFLVGPTVKGVDISGDPIIRDAILDEITPERPARAPASFSGQNVVSIGNREFYFNPETGGLTDVTSRAAPGGLTAGQSLANARALERLGLDRERLGLDVQKFGWDVEKGLEAATLAREKFDYTKEANAARLANDLEKERLQQAGTLARAQLQYEESLARIRAEGEITPYRAAQLELQRMQLEENQRQFAITEARLRLAGRVAHLQGLAQISGYIPRELQEMAPGGE